MTIFVITCLLSLYTGNDSLKSRCSIECQHWLCHWRSRTSLLQDIFLINSIRSACTNFSSGDEDEPCFRNLRHYSADINILEKATILTLVAIAPTILNLRINSALFTRSFHYIWNTFYMKQVCENCFSEQYNLNADIVAVHVHHWIFSWKWGCLLQRLHNGSRSTLHCSSLLSTICSWLVKCLCVRFFHSKYFVIIVGRLWQISQLITHIDELFWPFHSAKYFHWYLPDIRKRSWQVTVAFSYSWANKTDTVLLTRKEKKLIHSTSRGTIGVFICVRKAKKNIGFLYHSWRSALLLELSVAQDIIWNQRNSSLGAFCVVSDW